MSLSYLSNGLKIGGVTALIALGALGAQTAHAGGGAVIGKTFDDLATRFNKAANPVVPPKIPAPKLEHRPPDYVPGGTQTWSPARVPGASPPVQHMHDTFNRTSRDRPASSGLTDLFNHARRAFE